MNDLTDSYAATLRRHLLGDDEEITRNEAYELGRLALCRSWSMLDVLLLHHAVLWEFLAGFDGHDPSVPIRRAGEFLAECLSPFDMALRGYRESNERLGGVIGDLERINSELHSTYEELRTETERRHQAQAVLYHNQRLQAVGQLAGGIAHHFNNLFTVVLGNLELASTRLQSGGDVTKLIAGAQRGAARGADLTTQLLAYSRQRRLEPRIVDPAQKLNEIGTLLGSALRGDIAVNVDAPEGLWPIEVDPNQLELALLNLGLNARDWMPRGGTLRVKAANRHIEDGHLGLSGDYLVIEVADTGLGIAPEVLPHVFDPFFTTKEVGTGTGLGLSQVHGFAHQSGGAVEAESRPGQGATFRLYLPPAPASVRPPSASSRDAPEAGDPSGRTVLVVDDDLDVADVATDVLEEAGYAVCVAHRADAALNLLRSGRKVDMVFSDIVLPGGMDGIALADEVRRIFPELPVLLATGYAETLRDAVAKGLPILPKPYRTADLCERVGRMLSRA